MKFRSDRWYYKNYIHVFEHDMTRIAMPFQRYSDSEVTEFTTNHKENICSSESEMI